MPAPTTTSDALALPAPAAAGGRLRSLLRGPVDDPSWARPLLLLLLAGTAVLHLVDLSSSGTANSFYAAAVKSGTQSLQAPAAGRLPWSATRAPPATSCPAARR